MVLGFGCNVPAALAARNLESRRERFIACTLMAVAVPMLVPLGLDARQFVSGAVVLAAYFPCVATFTVLVKEMGVRDMFKSAVIMVLTAFTTGFVLNMLLDTIIAAAYLAAGLVILALILALIVGSTSDRRELKDFDSVA